MNKLLILAAFAVCAFAAPNIPRAVPDKLAEECDPAKCKLPNCRCSSTKIPNGLNATDIPQLVYLTFDDAVTITNDVFYDQLHKRKNPDGCPIQMTYFHSHEYTDYSVIQKMHSKGHEIALHSITHKSLTEYWKNLSYEEMTKEFKGQIEIVTHFAQIPKADIKGARLPLLQQSGNTSYQVFNDIGLKYDCSWPTRSFTDPPLWPYTLDYLSIQDCPIGPCPDASIPGFWVQPMVMWFDDNGVACSMVDQCTNIPTDVDGIVKFMIRNFDNHYNTTRAPFGVYIHAAWFRNETATFEAYQKFLDYIGKIKDVYIVGIDRGLEWMQKPTLTKDLKTLWPSCPKIYTGKCGKGVMCFLKKTNEDGSVEERMMQQCVTCPKKYPWLNNPLGKEKRP